MPRAARADDTSEWEVAVPFTWDDPQTGDTHHYSVGDPYPSSHPHFKRHVADVDGPTGRRPALIRKRASSPAPAEALPEEN